MADGESAEAGRDAAVTPDGAPALLAQALRRDVPWTGTGEVSTVRPVPRTSLLAAALTLSACLANASVVNASSSSTQASAGPAHASTSAGTGLLQGPQTLVTSKQTAINKIKTLLTTFFTDQQLSRILDELAEDVYAGKPFKESFGTLVAPGGLTQGQLAILVKLGGSQTGSASGVPLTKALAVLSRKFEPHYNDMSKKIFAMKSSPKTKADCFNQVYVMVTGHLTKANVAPVLTGIKSGLTSKEWQSMRTHGATLFLWSRYGL
ncbi:hypothetical protein ACLQ2R_37035 [Streptosporangium sp. DT93]|uniref:hypothetical protein n=1 Tax=Streptosporangium sp. DT93 TaxID=3393428 RepID=UPI003CE81880